MDLIAAFPFLGMSHAVSFMLIPFASYQFCTVLCDSSGWLLDLPCCGLTSHKSLCHVVSELGELLLFHCR